MIHHDPDFLVIRIVGAIVGAFLSLVYIPPSTVRSLVRRASFSAISGFVLGFVVLETMRWPETTRHWLAASVVTAAASWVVAGVAVRMLKKADRWPPWKG